MSKIAVVYWSQTGNTEAMANLVADGARAAGAEADAIAVSDFSADKISEYDAFAFGCPAMGDEVLEEDEFQPLWDSVKASLAGKKVALFGSYGWGDGQWMRDWESDAQAAGVTLAKESVTVNDAPEGDGEAACRELGASLA